MSLFGKLTEDMRLDIKIGGDGSVQGMLNAAEETARFKSANEMMQKWMQSMGVPPGALEQGGKMFGGLFDPKTAPPAELVDPSIHFYALRGEFRLGERSAYQHVLPSRFGGRPFPATTGFHLSKFDRVRKFATIDVRKVIDGKKAVPILLESISALMSRVEGSAPRDIKRRVKQFSKYFKLEAPAQYIMNTASGWPVAVVYQLSMSGGRGTGGHERRGFRLF